MKTTPVSQDSESSSRSQVWLQTTVLCQAVTSLRQPPAATHALSLCARGQANGLQGIGLPLFASIALLLTLVPTIHGEPTTPAHCATLVAGRNLQSAYLLRDRTAQPWGHGPRPPLQAHFADVLCILERDTEQSLGTALNRLETARDASWTVEDREDWRRRLAAERERNIRVLREYQARGLFPINDLNPIQTIPIFVDRHDTACAVGYLMRRSGAVDSVAAIVHANNFVYVTDVHGGPLVDWILTSGLTQEEAALIQPSYGPAEPPAYTSPYYINEGGTITITGYVEPDGTIPDSIAGLPVTSIAYGAFWGRDELTHVTIPSSVTNLGFGAFAYCSNLTNVTMGDGATRIESFAFYYCTRLTDVTMGYGAASIGESAFHGCASLRSITIPNTVTNIGFSAFSYCSGLTNLAVPDSVRSIGSNAFADCAGLTSVTLGSGVSNIGDGAFYGCRRLTSATVPDSVTAIGEETFALCSSLTNVSIGVGVTNIGSWAFRGCTSLTTVTIPGRVTGLGYEVFRECSSLTAIEVAPINPSYSSVEGVLFDKNRTTLIQYPGGKAGGYAVPNGVSTIGNYAFASCLGLTIVTIPKSVTRIEGLAFYECSALTAAFFQGNAPTLGCIGCDGTISGTPATIYHVPGTSGWGATFGGRPTAPWHPQNPLILTSVPGSGVRPNEFGFTIYWATNQPVLVEACADLANPVWTPVRTNALVNGSSYFSDPEWTHHPNRFYRLRSL